MSHNTLIAQASYDGTQKHKFKNNFLVEGESLGSGGFGTVYKVKKTNNLGDEKYYALKIIDVSKIKHLDNCKSEVQTFSILNNSNVVRYYDAWVEDFDIPKSKYEEIRKSENELSDLVSSLSDNESNLPKRSPYNFHRDTSDTSTELSNNEEIIVDGITIIIKKFLFIQMELCEGSLREMIEKKPFVNNNEIYNCFFEICSGLQHIHEKGIIHRDLKPENIFFSEGKFKIGDFGLSKLIKFENEMMFKAGGLNKFCLEIEQTNYIGSSLYMAPEVKSDSKKYSQKVDIYSLGLTFFEMCYKLNTLMEKSVVFEALKNNGEFPSDFVPVKNWCKIIKFLLKKDTKERWDITTLVKFLISIKPVNTAEFLGHISNLSFKENILKKKEYTKNLKKIKESAFNQAKFIKVATHVFQLHGAQFLILPTLLPKTKNKSGLKSVNIQGDKISVLSISNDSRPVFAQHVRLNRINDFRRYSIGKVYQENTSENSLPIEIQECSFDIISPHRNYLFADAEILYTAYQINEMLLFTKNNNIYIKYNNLNIVKYIIDKLIPSSKEKQRQCLRVLEETTNEFLSKKELEIKLKNIDLTPSVIYEFLILYEYDDSTISRLLLPFKNYILKFKDFIDKFDVPNAKFTPLLVTDSTQYSSFMFKILYKTQPNRNCFEVATGGRYDNAVNTNKYKTRSAVGISFNVEIMSTILTMDSQTNDYVDVRIIGEPEECIPIMKVLWQIDVSCKIMKECSHPHNFIIFPLSNENFQLFHANGRTFFVSDYKNKQEILKSLLKP